MRLVRLLGAMSVVALGCAAPSDGSGRLAADARRTRQPDSAQARTAVQQYLAALARRDYDAAARLHVPEWRRLAPAMVEYAPDSLSLAGFLRLHCERGFYVCGLRLERVTEIELRAPDTIEVSFLSVDSAGTRYTWGPCCGNDDGPDSVNVLRVVARDSNYAVVGLPLYVP